MPASAGWNAQQRAHAEKQSPWPPCTQQPWRILRALHAQRPHSGHVRGRTCSSCSSADVRCAALPSCASSCRHRSLPLRASSAAASRAAALTALPLEAARRFSSARCCDRTSCRAPAAAALACCTAATITCDASCRAVSCATCTRVNIHLATASAMRGPAHCTALAAFGTGPDNRVVDPGQRAAATSSPGTVWLPSRGALTHLPITKCTVSACHRNDEHSVTAPTH